MDWNGDAVAAVATTSARHGHERGFPRRGSAALDDSWATTPSMLAEAALWCRLGILHSRSDSGMRPRCSRHGAHAYKAIGGALLRSMASTRIAVSEGPLCQWHQRWRSSRLSAVLAACVGCATSTPTSRPYPGPSARSPGFVVPPDAKSVQSTAASNVHRCTRVLFAPLTCLVLGSIVMYTPEHDDQRRRPWTYSSSGSTPTPVTAKAPPCGSISRRRNSCSKAGSLAPTSSLRGRRDQRGPDRRQAVRRRLRDSVGTWHPARPLQDQLTRR